MKRRKLKLKWVANFISNTGLWLSPEVRFDHLQDGPCRWDHEQLHGHICSWPFLLLSSPPPSSTYDSLRVFFLSPGDSMCQDTSTMMKFTVFIISMYAHGRQRQLAGVDSPTVWVLRMKSGCQPLPTELSHQPWPSLLDWRHGKRHESLSWQVVAAKPRELLCLP